MRGSSDCGARRSAPSGGVAPSTVGLANPMSENDDAGQESPGTIATLARADRAYHDVAQFHLHEFGGDA
jgi:hypothetical protein